MTNTACNQVTMVYLVTVLILRNTKLYLISLLLQHNKYPKF